jgi:hypothetical protein
MQQQNARAHRWSNRSIFPDALKTKISDDVMNLLGGITGKVNTKSSGPKSSCDVRKMPVFTKISTLNDEQLVLLTVGPDIVLRDQKLFRLLKEHLDKKKPKNHIDFSQYPGFSFVLMLRNFLSHGRSFKDNCDAIVKHLDLAPSMIVELAQAPMRVLYKATFKEVFPDRQVDADTGNTRNPLKIYSPDNIRFYYPKLKTKN